MITHYDLFAGIGGFSLALEEVFHDEKIKHIFCEWEQFPTAVLKKHWPEGIYYGDIADLVADTNEQGWSRGSGKDSRRHRQSGREVQNQEQGMVVLTGGFPCQPFSHAGRRKGTADDRYQWPNMFAVIRNVRPDWVIAENVRGLTTWSEGLVLEQVCADLEGEGYEVQPIIIPAVAVNAPHRRDRVWIIAYRNGERKPAGHREVQKTDGKVPEWHDDAKPSNAGVAATDTRSQRRQTRSSESVRPQGQEPERPHYQYPDWQRDWREVAFATCNDGVDDGLPRKMDGATERGKQTDQISAAKHRKERLKAMGNAIVPQVAMQIFEAIKVAEYDRQT